MNRAPQKRAFSWLTDRDIAHRGLCSPGTLREENTVAAVAAAVDAGYAVEIDVRLTRDDRVVVFHDAALDRMTSGTGYVSEQLYSCLRTFPVGESGKPMPLLEDVLDIIAGRVPLFIEMKLPNSQKPSALPRAIRRAIEGYRGHLAVMSFNPEAVFWFTSHVPHLPRGLVVDTAKRLFHVGIRRSWMAKRAAADFIAHDFTSQPNRFSNKWRASGRPLISWTIKTREDELKGRNHADALIFEAPAVVGEDNSG